MTMRLVARVSRGLVGSHESIDNVCVLELASVPRFHPYAFINDIPVLRFKLVNIEGLLSVIGLLLENAGVTRTGLAASSAGGAIYDSVRSYTLPTALFALIYSQAILPFLSLAS